MFLTHEMSREKYPWKTYNLSILRPRSLFWKHKVVLWDRFAEMLSKSDTVPVILLFGFIRQCILLVLHEFHYGTVKSYSGSLFSLLFLLFPLSSLGQPWNALFHFSFLILRQSVGLLVRGISKSQEQNKRGHPCLEWDSNPQSQRSSGRRQFMP
jgi:hypothetical protein